MKKQLNPALILGILGGIATGALVYVWIITL